MMIEMALSRVILQDTKEHHYIFLRECEGHRTFPIVIGSFEAQEIWRQAQSEKTPRPFTHELLGRVLTGLGGELLRVVVNDLRNNTFFARMVVEHEGRQVEIDARPSDAIAVATRFRVPIFVEEDVLGKVLEE